MAAKEGTGMEFCLLGPLMVLSRGSPVPVPRGKQRAVLAVLLLNAGRTVSVDELADVLWGPAPPPSARVTIQNYVKRLRKSISVADDSRITTQPHGYLIAVDAGELDLARFERLLSAARAAARDGSWDQAAARAGEALQLWRGEPLADVDSDLLAQREVPRLTELRLQAAEARIDADLHLGRHADVITELRRLAAVHRLRERLYALLMLALYRDGRQAEALAVYHEARSVLVAELGAEPGSELRNLQQQILTADPALAVGAPSPLAAPDAAAPQVVPRELPAGVRHFTGRDSELAALSGLLEQTGAGAPPTVVISAISGTAGVGKTALAVHCAHQIAGRFTDGQLYVNLRGYDPGQPMSPADALAGFLRALGVAGQDIPAEETERAARFRSLLAGRRMLVVLDNASSVGQVRPLLPGSPTCAVIVTSRDSLAGLVARDGAARLDLDTLPLPDAVGLLRALTGARVDADPGAAATLADQCCRLPLALRVAAELAATRPAVPLAFLVGELADQRRRLHLLEAGADPRTAVRAVFSWSYRHLDSDAARAFGLLGLHPGASFDACSAAALTERTPEQAGDLLDLLARAHLVQPCAAGRYGMHDLLRAYAREQAVSRDDGHDGHDGQAALARVYDYYVRAAAAAMDVLYPAEHDRRPRIPAPATTAPLPPINGPAAAREWLDRERATLVEIAVHAAAGGQPGHAARLAPILFRYLDAAGRFEDTATVAGCARDAARDTGDSAAEATALLCLGSASWRLGRYEDAAACLGQALEQFRAMGDRRGEARALSSIGVVESCHGRRESAASYHRQALLIFRACGDRLGQALALDSLSGVMSQQGDQQAAAGHLRAALAIYRQVGDRQGEAGALFSLGVAEWQQTRYQQAIGHLEQALAVFREIGDRRGQARALYNIGVVAWWLGKPEQAAESQRAAAAVFREIGDRQGETAALSAYDTTYDEGETAGEDEPLAGAELAPAEEPPAEEPADEEPAAEDAADEELGAGELAGGELADGELAGG